jgi:ornithine--oxo-acid transaminase
VFRPGEHGSTFGGNPLASAIGIEVIELLREGTYQRASAELGAWLVQALRDAALPHVTEIRGRGLWIGIDLDPAAGTARAICEQLMARQILAKDTHESTVRLAPPLCVSLEDLAWALERIVDVIAAA